MIMMMLLPFVLRFPFYAWLSKGWREYIPPTLTCLAFLSMGISCVCLLSKERMKEPSSISLRVHTLVLLEVRCVVAVYSMCVSVLARRRRRWKRCSLGFAFWEVLFFHLQWCCCSFLSSSLRESIHLLFFLFPLLSFCPNIILLLRRHVLHFAFILRPVSLSCWRETEISVPVSLLFRKRNQKPCIKLKEQQEREKTAWMEDTRAVNWYDLYLFVQLSGVDLVPSLFFSLSFPVTSWQLDFQRKQPEVRALFSVILYSIRLPFPVSFTILNARD